MDNETELRDNKIKFLARKKETANENKIEDLHKRNLTEMLSFRR